MNLHPLITFDPIWLLWQDWQAKWESARSENRTLLAGKEELVRVFNAKVAELDAVVATLTTQLSIAGNDRNHLEEQLEKVERHVKEQESRLRAIAQENELAENAIDVLKGRIVELEAVENAAVTSLNSQLAQLLTSQRDQVAKIEALTSAKASAENDVAALRAQSENYAEEVVVLKIRVSEREAALKKSDGTVTAMTTKYNDATAAGAAEKINADEKIDQLSKQALELATGRAVAVKEIEALSKNLEEMHARIEYLEKKIASAEVFSSLCLYSSFHHTHLYTFPFVPFVGSRILFG